ncbi:hypothetical protein [Streptomyces sp. NPDC049906]|uniref:hypothetical protein n=1 Tax=Streptomyces sp. NPDC049906 TaxID=3155656 RepID=UPI00343EF5FE
MRVVDPLPAALTDVSVPANPVNGPYEITDADADEPVLVRVADKRGEPPKVV